MAFNPIKVGGGNICAELLKLSWLCQWALNPIQYIEKKIGLKIWNYFEGNPIFAFQKTIRVIQNIEKIEQAGAELGQAQSSFS